MKGHNKLGENEQQVDCLKRDTGGSLGSKK